MDLLTLENSNKENVNSQLNVEKVFGGSQSQPTFTDLGRTPLFDLSKNRGLLGEIKDSTPNLERYCKLFLPVQPYEKSGKNGPSRFCETTAKIIPSTGKTVPSSTVGALSKRTQSNALRLPIPAHRGTKKVSTSKEIHGNINKTVLISTSTKKKTEKVPEKKNKRVPEISSVSGQKGVRTAINPKQGYGDTKTIGSRNFLGDLDNKTTGAIRKVLSKSVKSSKIVKKTTEKAEGIVSPILYNALPNLAFNTENVTDESSNCKQNIIIYSKSPNYEMSINELRNPGETQYVEKNYLQAGKLNSGISVTPHPPVQVIVSRLNRNDIVIKLTDKFEPHDSNRISHEFNIPLCSSTKNNHVDTSPVNPNAVINYVSVKKETNKGVQTTEPVRESISEAGRKYVRDVLKKMNIGEGTSPRVNTISTQVPIVENELIDYAPKLTSEHNSSLENPLEILNFKNITYREKNQYSSPNENSSMNMMDSKFVDGCDFFYEVQTKERSTSTNPPVISTEYMISPIKPNHRTSRRTLISTSMIQTPKKKTLSKTNLRNARNFNETSPYTCDIYESNYRNEIIKNLLSRDNEYVLRRNFQQSYNPNTEIRREVLNWIMKRQDILHLDVAMYIMVARLFDNILAKTKIPINMYQLVLLTNVWIITKCHSTVVISTPKLLKLCNNVYSQRQLFRMEKKLLKLFDFNFTINEPMIFAAHLLEELGMSNNNKITCCVGYILETFTLSAKFTTFSPSELAASSIYLSLKILHPVSNLYRFAILPLGYYDPKDFQDIVKLMLIELGKVKDKKTEIGEAYLKYSTLDKNKISILVTERLFRPNDTLCLV